MPREASIPLFLWVSSALVFHLGFSGGAEGVTRAVEELDAERADIVGLVRGVRGELRGSAPIEGEFLDVEKTEPEAVAQDDTNDPNAESDQDVPEEAKKNEPQKIPKLEVAKVEPPKPEAPKPEPPKAEPEPPKPEVAKKEEPPVKAEFVPPKPEQRISVKQHAEKNQPDNPNANKLAKDANTVTQETMARHRNLERDDMTPQPASAAGAAGAVGNSERELIREMEDRKGDDRRAPGEAAKDATATERAEAQRGTKGQSEPSAAAARPPADASKGSVGGAGNPTPESVSSDSGSWSLDPMSLGGTGGGNKSGAKKKATLFVPNVNIFGFGVGTGTEDGPPNLGAGTLEASVGAEQLEKERAAFGASIRSEHRGRFDTNKFQRYKAAIENYDPSVKLGNETALNTAASPFAEYLHHMHTRIHPIYGDQFLASGMAASAGLKDMNMMTAVEIILNPKDGSVIGVPGVVKRSGSTILDAVAIDAVMRAAPFGEAPPEILSPDGKVYLHWEFHRDPVDACSTKNAHPKMLKKIPAKKVPVDKPKPPKPPQREETVAPPGQTAPKKGQSAKIRGSQPAR